jgi:hypothetical protein
MRLNTPKNLTLLIAVIIAVIALSAWLASVFGFVTLCVTVYAFWTMVIAFVLLLCGCLVKGL